MSKEILTLSPGIVGGRLVTLKYNFAHMTFWVDIALRWFSG